MKRKIYLRILALAGAAALVLALLTGCGGKKYSWSGSLADMDYEGGYLSEIPLLMTYDEAAEKLGLSKLTEGEDYLVKEDSNDWDRGELSRYSSTKWLVLKNAKLKEFKEPFDLSLAFYTDPEDDTLGEYTLLSYAFVVPGIMKDGTTAPDYEEKIARYNIRGDWLPKAVAEYEADGNEAYAFDFSYFLEMPGLKTVGEKGNNMRIQDFLIGFSDPRLGIPPVFWDVSMLD